MLAADAGDISAAHKKADAIKIWDVFTIVSI
jgi:hypothetical protein